MMSECALIAVICGLAIFLILLCAIIFLSESGYRKKKGKEGQWIFDGFTCKVYDALFGGKDAEQIVSRMGINVREYKRDCSIAGKKEDFEKMAVYTVYGYFFALTGLTLSLFSSLLLAFAGIFLYAYFCLFEKRIIRRQAENKRKQIEEELPRFLDLLRTQLNVGMPVETAIYVICERTDTLLSKEFFLALRKMEFGASEWGEAMEAIAAKYNVDPLSSFVLHVVTAYRKGVSVASAVEREYRDIHKSMLLNIKDRAEKTKSAALLPMFVFQLFPLIIFISLPLIVTLVAYM